MLDFSLGEMAVIGAVGLVVLGPEKLPKITRAIGHWIGKAQRYVNDVKSELHREVQFDELQKLQQEVQDSAREIESSVQETVSSINEEAIDLAAFSTALPPSTEELAHRLSMLEKRLDPLNPLPTAPYKYARRARVATPPRGRKK